MCQASCDIVTECRVSQWRESRSGDDWFGRGWNRSRGAARLQEPRTAGGFERSGREPSAAAAPVTSLSGT